MTREMQVAASDTSPADLYERWPIFRRIALRIGLLSWFTSVVAVGVFVLVAIPQQKDTFVRNLESKARGVVVSLADVAAGAAVNEDYAGLVSASQALLTGDADLDFIVFKRLDGFALLNSRVGWSVQAEADADAFWEPEGRTASSGITFPPLQDHRSFHYAFPFDYSGIEWGWIHIGLSLDAYDESVRLMYRQFILLALGCLLLSFLLSFGYARLIVRPVLRLRAVVHRIAEGDLTIRAEATEVDELGDLGRSVNIMTEALRSRGLQLEGASEAIQEILSAGDIHTALPKALAIIGTVSSQDRAFYFDVVPDSLTGELRAWQRHEWVAEGVAPQAGNPDLQGFPIDALHYERTFLEAHDVRSLFVLPVTVDGHLRGFLGMENVRSEEGWTDSDEALLSSVAASVGTALRRYETDQALREAKANLEERVEERTLELRNQVEEKAKAMTELAETQAMLVEVSRTAGMAEVATGVLHNVGNVLNSVNVSCNLLVDQVRESRMVNVGKLADLMRRPADELIQFLTEDPRGRQVPGYLGTLAQALEKEREVLLTETISLQEKIEHIKEIVAMQQSYGRVLGLVEILAPEQLMEDALKLNQDGLSRHQIEVIREYERVHPIPVDKHRVIQILLNLIHNAKYACEHASKETKVITLRIRQPDPDRVHLEVSDRGVGIAAENLTRIFQHGFTTRKDGHGFGLHSGAVAAKELGGSLIATSPGLGLGSTFTLELPAVQLAARSA